MPNLSIAEVSKDGDKVVINLEVRLPVGSFCNVAGRQRGALGAVGSAGEGSQGSYSLSFMES